VVNQDGSMQEYVDVQAGFDKASVNSSNLKEMDCITCHNRITHLVPQPEDTVDKLIAQNLISADIPDIHRQAVDVYSRVYDSTEKGLIGIAAIEQYYQKYYPDYYQANRDKIQGAIKALQDTYAQNVFPQQNSDWSTHPNNIGHKDSPGCFRCHDGKHLNADQQAIRLECNLCHTVPVVAGPDDFVAKVEFSRGPEPDSHKNQNWISLHNQAIDETCSNCHTTADAGGVSNTSFCSNSACHGSTWKFAGFDAPKMRDILLSQLPPKPTPTAPPEGQSLTYAGAIGALFQTRCGGCHGQNGMNGGNSGPAVVPGNPQASLVIQKQTASQPHFSQLSPQELDLVTQWIAAGAPEK
jgi:mono/diheme cytochrome c family protein